MTEPTDAHLEQLTALFRFVAQHRTTITYGEVARIINLDAQAHQLAKRLGDLADRINRTEHAAGRPLLSAVLVNKTERLPGGGFYDLARDLGLLKGDQSEAAFWAKELQRVHRAARPD